MSLVAHSWWGLGLGLELVLILVFFFHNVDCLLIYPLWPDV